MNLVLATLLAAAAPQASSASGQAPAPPAPIRVRIGDLADIRGVRNNQLTGLGIVAGLSGTGDQQNATRQAIANFLRLNNLNVSTADVNAGNVALVTVTATLEPFKANGARIDVTVSAMEAKSLAGGVLQQTRLYGADGIVYATAQGSLSIGGGYQAAGAAASATKGHLTVATVPNGALVEQEVPMQIVSEGGILKLDLRAPDFTTARRVAEAINEAFPGISEAKSAGEIWVSLPSDLDQAGGIVPFIAAISEREVVPESPAVIVINERTGTIVAGEHVKVRPSSVVHGQLTITVEESPIPSQPPALSQGETVVVPRTNVTVDEEKTHAAVFPGAVSVSDLVYSLNALQVTPRDLIAILQMLKRQGALHAELVIM